MSCFILSIRSLSALAKSIDTVLNGGYPFCGFSLTRDSENILRKYGPGVNELFHSLAEINALAYDRRYKEWTNTEVYELDKEAPDYFGKPLEYEGDRYIFTAEHYQVLKTIQCYLYQTAEQATDGHELREALAEIVAGLQDAIITSMPEYIGAKWG